MRCLFSQVRVVALAASVAALTACAKSSSSPASSATTTNDSGTSAQGPVPTVASGGFFGLSDLANPGTLTSISAATLEKVILSDSSFYNHNPNPPNLDCTYQALIRHNLQASNGQVTLDMTDNDMLSCMNEQSALQGSTVTYSQFTYRVFQNNVCPGVDLTRFNGLPASLLADIGDDVCDQAGAANESYLSNIHITYTAQIPGAGANVTATGDTRNATLTSAGKPCSIVRQGKTFTDDGCQHTTAAIVKLSSGSAQNSYKQVVSNKLAANAGAVFYNSGATKFIYNDWTGTMTFTGATTNPTWTATSPSSGNASGTFPDGPAIAGGSGTAGNGSGTGAALALVGPSTAQVSPTEWLRRDVERVINTLRGYK